MPIRINLLAEAQALEDLRRRDPVKRAIWLGVGVVILLLGWSGWLQLTAMMAKGELSRLEARLHSHTNEFQQVLDNQKKLGLVRQKMGALDALATNRFLYGTMLDSLQHATLSEVHLVRFKAEQSFAVTEATKPRTNANRVTPGRPATVAERMTLTFDAKDFNPVMPGDSVNKYKETISGSPYFQDILGRTNEVRLTALGAPQPPGPDGRPFVLFTLECRYPEKNR
jgi:hypothetical protein